MDISSMIKQQKMGIVLHRTVYAIFLLAAIFYRFENRESDGSNCILF